MGLDNNINNQSNHSILESSSQGCKDASDVRDIINSMSTNVRKIGRYTAYSIIGISWTLSYQYSQFHPDSLIKWAMLLAIIYLFLDFVYYLFMTYVYKSILVEYFTPLDGDGFTKKDGKDISACTKKWMHFGSWQMLINSLLLIISSILLIIDVCYL